MPDVPSKKTIADHLQKSGQELQSVLTKIKELERLNQKFLFHLDPALKNYCQIANWQNNRLIILAANASVATQLRFQIPDLLKKFKQDSLLKKFQDIHCIVRPFSSRLQSMPHPRKINPLSPETAKQIHEIAQSLSDDKLREVMEKIAKHVKSCPLQASG